MDVVDKHYINVFALVMFPNRRDQSMKLLCHNSKAKIKSSKTNQQKQKQQQNSKPEGCIDPTVLNSSRRGG